jgi:hypothetical protein
MSTQRNTVLAYHPGDLLYKLKMCDFFYFPETGKITRNYAYVGLKEVWDRQYQMDRMMDDGRATRRLGNVAVNSGTRSGSVEMIIVSEKKIDNSVAEWTRGYFFLTF